MSSNPAYLLPFLIRLSCLIFPLLALELSAAEIDELTQEQAQQVVDNFQALRDSLDQGKAEIEKLQGKISQIKQASEWLNDENHGQELQRVLDKLEKNGLSSKLQNAHSALDTISRSTDHISSTAEKIKGQYDQVKEFYDTWHPDRHNPVRPLELVANGLGELESIIQALDPSPDNVLTKPITAFVDYYKQASEAFAGALTRLQAQIEERRQNCVGTGCENYSVKGEAFLNNFTGVGPAWLYRPLQEGEIWYDGDGRAFLWWNDKWLELQGGIGRFDEVYHGWHLAHGKIISTTNLIGRINSNYESVIAARQRAGKYWIILNSSTSCHGDLFNALKQGDTDRDRILSNSNHDQKTFLARYMFLQSARGNTDKLIDAFDNTLLVRGVVVDDKGNSVAGASINASSAAATASSTSIAGGWFSLQFKLQPDASSKQIATVSVSHNDHQPSESEQRLWQKCEDWRITLNSSDETEQNEALAELQTIRDTALAKAAEINAQCQALGSENEQISNLLNTLPRPSDNNPAAAEVIDVSSELTELGRRAGELAQESDTQAKALAQSSKELSERVTAVCEKTTQLESTADSGRKQQLFQAMQSDQAQAQSALTPLQSGFPRLTRLAEQAGAIKTQAASLQTNLAENQTQANDNPALESLRPMLAGAQRTSANIKSLAQELNTLRTRAAFILRKQANASNKQQLDTIFAEITASRDRAAACVQNNTAQLDALAAQVEQLAQATASNTATQQSSPQNITAELERINILADEAINNAAIAERFFSLAEMQGKIEQGATCLARAESALQDQEQNALLAALNNCDLAGAEREIARGNGSAELVQRYETLRQQETTIATDIQRAEGLRRDCRFKQAEDLLSNTLQLGSCEASQNKVMQTLLVVKGEARKSAAAEQAWNEADGYYRQGDYNSANQRLQQAKQNATCPEQISKINNGINQINQQLQAANNPPPTPTANSTPPPSATGATSAVCQQYQQELMRIGNYQQELAVQSQRIRTQQEAATLQTRLMENSRRFLTLVEQSRAAGCHDTDIPPEVRSAMGMPPSQSSQSSGTSLQCAAPRVAGVSKETGQPACVCPGELMWSKKRQQCLTFGELIGGSEAWDKLDKALEEGTQGMRN